MPRRGICQRCLTVIYALKGAYIKLPCSSSSDREGECGVIALYFAESESAIDHPFRVHGVLGCIPLQLYDTAPQGDICQCDVAMGCHTIASTQVCAPAIEILQWDFADFYHCVFQSAAFDQPQSHLTLSSCHNTDDRAIYDDRREQDVSQGSRTRYDKAIRHL
jgi:hypothetical protein